MKRIVPIIVTDDRVTHLAIEHQDDNMVAGEGEWPDLVKAERVPVPADDQLTRDLEGVCMTAQEAALGVGPEGYHVLEAIGRLRAAFRLDKEGG